MIFKSASQADTEGFAERLGRNAAAGQVYCLIGGLGAGKTAFARGFAKGLGVCGPVTSPTFAILNVYAGRLPLYHFDVYRIAHVDEMEDTGYRDYFYGVGVTLIEWADLIKELWPDGAIEVAIERGEGENERKIILQRSGHEHSCN